MRERHRELAQQVGAVIDRLFDQEGESDWLDRVEGVRNRVWRLRVPDRELAPIRGEARLSLAPTGQEPLVIFDAVLDFHDIDRCNSQKLRAMALARQENANLEYRIIEEYRDEEVTFSVSIGTYLEFNRADVLEEETVEEEVAGHLTELRAFAEEVEGMVYMDDRPRTSHDRGDEGRPRE